MYSSIDNHFVFKNTTEIKHGVKKSENKMVNLLGTKVYVNSTIGQRNVWKLEGCDHGDEDASREPWRVEAGSHVKQRN